MPIAPITSRVATPATVGAAPPAAEIVAMGAALPAGLITNADLEALVDTSDSWILERTGIRERHRVSGNETASTMGAAAAREALRRAGDPTPDLIIVATCSAETRLPSTACLIQRQLGLTGMPAFDVNAACTGFVYGLAIADGLVRSGAARTILLIASEALTPLVDYTERSTCVLFGDGAAAAVVGAGQGTGGIRAVRWYADGSDADLIYHGPAADRPDGPAALRMAGRGTFRMAVERLSQVSDQLLADAGWSGDDVDLYVPHQANQRIIEAAAKRLGVSMEKVFLNVERVGNTSAASIPLALADAQLAGRLSPGDRVIMVAFGSGVTWGGIALEWTANLSR